jgi:Lon protease-like protein
MTVTPMFPLEVTLLPGEELPLRIFEPRYSALVRDCLAHADEPRFGAVLIAAGREVGGGDERCDVGALARIREYEDFGEGRYALRCDMGQRIRVVRWLEDDPYPRATVEAWPDEAGEPVSDAAIRDVEDRIVTLFERIAAARGAQLPGRDVVLGGDTAELGSRLYTLASRVPMGQADRYCVLSAPTAAARLDALSEAVDTVTAMVDFQLSGD